MPTPFGIRIKREILRKFRKFKKTWHITRVWQTQTCGRTEGRNCYTDVVLFSCGIKTKFNRNRIWFDCVWTVGIWKLIVAGDVLYGVMQARTSLRWLWPSSQSGVQCQVHRLWRVNRRVQWTTDSWHSTALNAARRWPRLHGNSRLACSAQYTLTFPMI